MTNMCQNLSLSSEDQLIVNYISISSRILLDYFHVNIQIRTSLSRYICNFINRMILFLYSYRKSRS